MSDEKKLSIGQYNAILDAWLGKKPLEIDIPKSKPYDMQDYCSHQYEPYTGLFHTEYICKYCSKRQPSEPIESPFWGDTDDGASF